MVQTSFKDKRLVSHSKKNDKWELQVPKLFLELSKTNISELTLRQLYTYVFVYKKQSVVSDKYTVAFWKRIFQPFNILILMLLSVPVIFGPLRNSSFGVRILVGALLGFGFHLVSRLLGPASVVYQFSPILVFMLPIMIFFSVAVYLHKMYR